MHTPPKTTHPRLRAILSDTMPWFSQIDPYKNILIAGTNGKGSVAATLSALCTAHGLRTGLFTSPHLVNPRERIRINDQDLSQEAWDRASAYVSPWAARFDLNTFETYTWMAAHVFFSGAFGPIPDWVIWEVGLGGRLDPTNAIPHHYCGIAAIGLDHVEELGGTLESIAREKFGIIPHSGVVVAQPLSTDLHMIRKEFERRTQCQWIETPESESLLRLASNSPLAGTRGLRNTIQALTLFEQIGFNPENTDAALQNVRWPGRFSSFDWPHARCPIFLSGDHNTQGMESLVDLLNQRFQTQPWKRLFIVLGVASDKDLISMIETLSRLQGIQLVLTETPYRTRPLSEIPSQVLGQAAFSHSSPEVALNQAIHLSTAEDCIVITGSLYLVGHFLSRQKVDASALRKSLDRST